MAYDMYERVGNDLKRLVIPAGTPLPEGAKRIDWRKLCTMDHVTPTRESKIKKHGYDEYETTSMISEPE